MIQYKKDLYRSAALGSEIIAAICGPTPKRGNHGAWLLIHNSGEKFYRWFWWIHCSQVSQEFSEFLRDREGISGSRMFKVLHTWSLYPGYRLLAK